MKLLLRKYSLLTKEALVSDSRYIYAGARAHTLAGGLLSDNQLERLLGAKSVSESMLVLQDTFLAPFLVHAENDVSRAADLSVAQAKHDLVSSAPEQGLLTALWLKYDFYNVRTIVKGLRAKLSREEVLDSCFTTGTLSPARLFEYIESGRTRLLDAHLQAAYRDAQSAETAHGIDLATEAAYFVALRGVVEQTGDSFLAQYVAILIDLFNIRTALRVFHIEDFQERDVFVDGGTLSRSRLANSETLLKTLEVYGGKHEHWRAAIEAYTTTNSFVGIDKAAEEHIGNFLKREAQKSVFSPASLFAYFFAQKNHVQIIRAIIRAKEAHVPEKELRLILRQLYV